MRVRITLLIALFITTLLAGCGETGDREPENLSERVDLLIEEDRYEEALDLLESENKNDPEIQHLLEKSHLNYGLNSMSTFDAGQMRTRMNNALIQFAEVLKINPENEVARNQINQILGVYDTMPDRGPDPEAVEALSEVGIEP